MFSSNLKHANTARFKSVTNLPPDHLKINVVDFGARTCGNVGKIIVNCC